MAHLIPCNIACIAIATLYYTWRDVYRARILARAQKRLHERVAYLLWVVAAKN